MRVALSKIAQAIDLDGDESSKTVAAALRNLESILDAVAAGIEDDHQSAALGDASNLIQLIREGLTS